MHGTCIHHNAVRMGEWNAPASPRYQSYLSRQAKLCQKGLKLFTEGDPIARTSTGIRKERECTHPIILFVLHCFVCNTSLHSVQ